MSERAHGTRARYVFGPGPGAGPGCRCDRCSGANRAEAGRRARLMAYGQWQPYVDAGPAREHLRVLSAAGIGWKRAAELARLSTGTVSKLLFGGPGERAPSQRIRPETSGAILSIRPSADLAAPGTLVDSAGTRRRAQALVAAGWSRARIAAEAGMSPSNFGLVLQREQVYLATARTVREVYDRLWNQPPPEHDQRTRIAASRARNYAAARGWAPPLAWDDDAIDDPAASPPDGWKRPARARLRSGELAEEAEDLFRREGYTREHAAARLGVSLGALERALSRTREREHQAQRARFAEASPAPVHGYEAEAG